MPQLTESDMRAHEEKLLDQLEEEKKSMMDAAETIAAALGLPTVPYLATIGHAFNLIINTFDELIALRHEQKKEEDDGTAPPHP